jgi:Raf kinase inhibitor-like YbhB/YbcL family protein
MSDYSMKKETNKYRKHDIISGFLAVAALTLVCAVSMSVNYLHAEEKMTLTLRSTAFTNGGEIPSKYTCEGEDIAPPLEWEGVPEKTRSLVLIIDDPDAPDPKAPRMTWVHWVLYNIPPDTGGLPEGVTSVGLPPETEEGLNDWKRTGYGGPCPPVGRHRYFHKLYALDTILEGMDMPTKTQIETAMREHVIAQTELVGTYKKS